jgi:hypothetical protein
VATMEDKWHRFNLLGTGCGKQGIVGKDGGQAASPLHILSAV